MKVRTRSITLAFALIVLACEQGGSATDGNKTSAPAAFPDALSADPAHYALLLENDVARLLRIKYAPGEKSVMHSHPAGCAFILVDHTMKFALASGDTTPSMPARVGEVVCFDEETHLPENVGNVAGELVLLELKGRKTFDNVQTGRSITIASGGSVREAVAADPSHYSVQFENDVVRILRIKFAGPGKSVTHAHPALCNINIIDAATRDTDASGKVTTSADSARAVNCGDALVHLPEVTSANGLETILIEFKNRPTFK